MRKGTITVTASWGKAGAILRKKKKERKKSGSHGAFFFLSERVSVLGWRLHKIQLQRIRTRCLFTEECSAWEADSRHALLIS